MVLGSKMGRKADSFAWNIWRKHMKCCIWSTQTSAWNKTNKPKKVYFWPYYIHPIVVYTLSFRIQNDLVDWLLSPTHRRMLLIIIIMAFCVSLTYSICHAETTTLLTIRFKRCNSKYCSFKQAKFIHFPKMNSYTLHMSCMWISCIVLSNELMSWCK